MNVWMVRSFISAYILLVKTKKVAFEVHRQFAHLFSDELIGLLKQSNINDNDLNNIIKNSRL